MNSVLKPDRCSEERSLKLFYPCETQITPDINHEPSASSLTIAATKAKTVHMKLAVRKTLVDFGLGNYQYIKAARE